MDYPVVTFELENGESFQAELYPDIAPNTVNNFLSLVQKGFYDGLTFHRIIPGFMVQGGDPEGNGTGGPGYSVRGEFSANGFPNPLKHTEGVLSMARATDPDSAGSQFFVMVAAAPYLDGDYAAFGKVIAGMDTVHRIEKERTNPWSDRPLQPVVLAKVTADLKGKTYPEPDML